MGHILILETATSGAGTWRVFSFVARKTSLAQTLSNSTMYLNALITLIENVVYSFGL